MQLLPASLCLEQFHCLLFTVLQSEAAVDQELKAVEEENGKKKTYTHYSAEDRAKIGRWAAENGNASACRKFKVPESTVCGFKTRYLAAVKVTKVCDHNVLSSILCTKIL